MRKLIATDYTEEFRAYIKLLEDKHNRMMSGEMYQYDDGLDEAMEIK